MDGYEDVPVLVTGGASGIGRASAERLAAAGARVTLLDHAVETERVAAAIPGAVGVRADVTDPEALAAALADVECPQVLVNSAGTDRPGRFLASDPAEWARIIAVDLVGTLACCHLLVPRMIAAYPSSAVVNVASDAGRVGSSQQAVYSAAKGGVIAFTKTLARELARDGVSVNVVCPGPTRTAMVEEHSAADPRLRAALERAIPLRRLAEPDEVAAAIAYLGAPRTRYVTGQTLSVSGGLTMV